MYDLPILLAHADSIPAFWLVFGFCGQGFLFSRFAVQWWVSERTGRSVVPGVFWVLSLIGAGILLTYFIYRHEPVGIAGQVGGFFIYSRNLVLIKRERTRAAS